MLPGDVSSAQSGFIVSLASDLASWMGLRISDEHLSLLIRKFAHFTEFFFLGISLSIYFIKEKIEIYHIFSLGFIIALIDESIQLFVSGRSGNLVDLGIDMLGILFAFIIIFIYTK
jgi:VanZ family protein